MEKKVFEYMRDSLPEGPFGVTTTKEAFGEWLTRFLVFAKTDKVFVSDLTRDIDTWYTIMSGEDGYESYKRYGASIRDYAAKTYVFLNHKEFEKEGELDNMSRLALDSDLVVEAFNMDFFGHGNSKLIMLSFVEALDRAVEKLQIPGVDIIEILLRFFRIYFSNIDYKIMALRGDPKSRFFKLYNRITGMKLYSLPNGVLQIDPVLYTKLRSEEQRSVIKEHLDFGLKPKTEDYTTVMEILSSLEPKITQKSVWASKEGVYYLYRNEKDSQLYLVNAETGAVIKVFNESMGIPAIISESEKLIG